MKIKSVILYLIFTFLICGVSYASYQPEQLITQGGVKKSLVTDLNQEGNLDEVLFELKEIKFQLMAPSDADVNIIDGSGNGNKAKVTNSGEVVVSPLSYNETSFNTMDIIDTAYNFFEPLPNKQFVITGMLVFADKDVGDASDTVIIVYEASDNTTTTVDKILLQFGMGKLTSLPFPSLNLLVNPGKWISAKTGDDDVHMTILGYYIDEIE